MAVGDALVCPSVFLLVVLPIPERRGAEEMRTGVSIPSEERRAEVPGPEGARGGEAGQVTHYSRRPGAPAAL